jgi:hypothetical protein
MEKRYIQPQELRSWWNWVRPGLEKVKEKSTEPWIPEDVYADCFEQSSMLWVFLINSRPVGFAVLQPIQSTIHVWCAYAYERDNMFVAWDLVQEIAKAGNATAVTFDSNRRGWEKTAKRLGFRPRKWIKEL